MLMDEDVPAPCNIFLKLFGAPARSYLMTRSGGLIVSKIR
jgi:hypothetical protein